VHKLLVERGADVHFNNDFPLHAAIWQHAYGHEDYEPVIRYLVENGSKPRGLCDCVRGGNLSATKLLLELGADANETDKDGSTALDLAMDGRATPEIARLLRENGGELSRAS
jgi:ankyrin repeat protein